MYMYSRSDQALFLIPAFPPSDLWLPKTLYVLTSLTFLPRLSYGPCMSTIALPVLSTLLGLPQSRTLQHLEILALHNTNAGPFRADASLISNSPRSMRRIGLFQLQVAA